MTRECILSMIQQKCRHLNFSGRPLICSNDSLKCMLGWRFYFPYSILKIYFVNLPCYYLNMTSSQAEHKHISEF